MEKVSVIGLEVCVADYESALKECLLLSKRGRAAVSAANTHIASASRANDAFGVTMGAFDLVLPDGMPLIWIMNHKLKRMGKPPLTDRVYGPYFMKYAIQYAPAGTTHYLFGGTEECLEELQRELRTLREDVRVVGICSPPYRKWSEEDQDEFARQVNTVSPDFIWVALGGEKQEQWIINNLHRYNRGVFFAIGDAFELLAGRRPFAPEWCQRFGMTWLYRLAQEPRRMFKRYCKYNLLFLRYLVTDWFRAL
jgi:N-acetylglucosaminyldiphosphoundecaprenol N-acetyl-beta-D-mannosaminyltransferase